MVIARLPPGKAGGVDLSAYPWLYLRANEPVAPGEQLVEVMAVGDVMLGRGVAAQSEPLAGVTPWLRTADLAIGNLECVVTEQTVARPGSYRLRCPPQSPVMLRRAGFDLLGLANNHALDFDLAGLADTVSRLAAAGLNPLGAGPGAQAADQPMLLDTDGLRLAFLAFNTVPDPDDKPGVDAGGWTPAGWDRGAAVAAVAAARAQADAVIVMMHWGREYEVRADPAQRSAARALLEAGAVLVIGYHPHVVQDTEVYEQGFVAYSLGNLVFDQEQGETRQGLALRAFFDRQGLRAVQALPVSAGPRPALMGLDEAAALIDRVQPPPARLAFACRPGPAFDCRPAAVPDEPSETKPPAGIFRAGEIDLTGDGLPEQVQLLREQVAVYSDGTEIWRGLPEWCVADVALGDPNDDGRSEMLIVLYKLDSAGTLRSHPFVVGYRGGIYRILWGGSAVADPIRELELGDVDGDGVQELIVLEEQHEAPGQAALAVWRWHGWGFSLLWRSPPGRYSNLALLPGSPGSPDLISVAVDVGSAAGSRQTILPCR